MEIKEDIGEKAISMLKEIEIKLKKKVEKQEQNKRPPRYYGKKNSTLHLLLETNLKEKLMKEAEEKDISVAELCRQKLRFNREDHVVLNALANVVERLDKMESRIDKMLK